MEEQRTEQFMQMHAVSEVAEMLDVPPGTVRQWEKSLEGVLVIPRDKKGARYYTEFEIDSLRRVKVLRDKGVSFEVIRELLQRHESDSESLTITSALPTMTQSEAVEALYDVRELLRNITDHIDQVVEERVKAEVSGRLDRLEERLEERDKMLMQTLHALQAQAEERAELDKRRGWWPWGKR